MEPERDDYDGPWKKALDDDFLSFLELFFPAVYAAIDTSRPPESLDKELGQITPSGESGVCIVDKLVRVWLREGGEAWVLVHVEVQSQRQAGFPRRVFVYHYRLLDYFDGRRVATLAVLADGDPTWRPDRYGTEMFGTAVTFRYPIVKLLDLEAREAELAESPNPFAVIGPR